MQSLLVRRLFIAVVAGAVALPMLWPVTSASAQDAAENAPAQADSPQADRAGAQEAAARPAPQISPEAAQLLEQVVKAYSELKTLRLAGKISAEFDVQQQQDSESMDFTAAYSAPNSFRHAVEGNMTAGSTGEKTYVHSTRGNVYMNAAAPREKVKVDELPPPLGQVLSAENPSLMLAVSKDPHQELTDNVKSITLAEPAQVDGKAHPVLHLELNDGPTIDLRIDPQTHLIRQAVIDLKAGLEQRGATDVKRAQMTIDYTTSEPGAQLDADTFAWSPPAGAKDIEEVRRQQNAGMEQRMAQLKAWEGKDAPDFKLPGLDGKEVALKDLKGSPVLLDFWATWCGPCIVSMPHVEAIHREKGQQGLKVFAVNIGEEKDQVQAFVQEKGWQLPILLDTDSSVGTAYGASAIPYQVLIDKEGKIRKVAVGAGGPMKEEMDKAIDELLGK